ncbi:acetyl esterase/lipase [Leucobacter luti]|uniref:alpha/beta hydrolase n=1 Tax=Leucobacter luti TaxID=340320 RepID=UPI001050C0F8|nr:alpha/beta hydrolase [Leucobacter luti]MCW2288279.1 acetyl esterase/lipase [Leucobacter luti]TCK45563.1 acetyl esterase/lipase [Leucobacter luti]
MTERSHVLPFRAAAPEPRPVPVPYDPELEQGLAHFMDLVESIPLRAHTILANRDHFRTVIPVMASQAEGRAVTWEDRLIPGPQGAPDIEVTIVRPLDPLPTSPGEEGSGAPAGALRPAVLGIHGGGYVLGTRFFGTGELIDLAETHGTIGVAVEYRLAPEHPAPAGAEDCYAALVWLAAHAAELGVDPDRIVVSGASAGGGLTAAVALMARDRGGPALAGQLINTPMIDDRNDTVSSWQYDGLGAWDRNNNDTGWDAMLGADRGTERVHPHQAPARAADLSQLPPAFLEVGSAEIFRDETIAYARRIWAAGGEAELHVWSGAYHGFSGFSPDAIVSQAANAARDSWWRRILSR